MPAYFASDIHLRLDQPERAERFARFVQRLGKEDSLTIGGDLCDFWFASRQRHLDPFSCPGLSALAAFRARGGTLTLIPGNHDHWIGSLYERVIGIGFTPEPLEIEVHGLRVHLVHGHLVGARWAWKGLMESRAFFQGFSALPEPIANAFESLLDRTNDRTADRAHQQHLVVYRRLARRLAERVDLCLFGHIHMTVDEPVEQSRMIVLGHWHERSSYVRVDEAGAEFVREDKGR